MDNNSDRHLQLNLPLHNQELTLEEAAQHFHKYLRQLYLRFPIIEVNKMAQYEIGAAAIRAGSELRQERRRKIVHPS